MATVTEDEPAVTQTGFTRDLITIFEANLRNSEECLRPYLEHAAKLWRMSVKWANNQIPRREEDPSFDDGEQDRCTFELAREIFVKLIPSFPKVEARTWRDLERWDPENAAKPSAGDLEQRDAVRDRGGESVEVS